MAQWKKTIVSNYDGNVLWSKGRFENKKNSIGKMMSILK